MADTKKGALGMVIGLALSAAVIFGIVYVASKGWKAGQKSN